MLLELLSLPALVSFLIVAAMALYVFRSKPAFSPPGPPGLPLIGYVPFLGNCPWKALYNMRQQYGNVISLYFGTKLTVILQDYDSIRAAFVEQADAYAGRGDDFDANYFASGIDCQRHGLVQMEPGQKWKATRRFIGEASEQLSFKMEKIILEEVEHLCSAVRNLEKKSFDPAEKVYPAMVSIMGHIAFGHRFGYEGSEEFKLLTRRINVLYHDLALDRFLQSYPWLRFFPGTQRRHKKIVSHVPKQWKFLDDEVAKHEARKKDGEEHVAQDILDALLHAATGKDQEISLAVRDKKDLVKTMEAMLSAGSETTTTSLLWALLYVVHQPSLLKKLQDEIDSAVAPGTLVTFEDRDKVSYTLATFYESMRLGGNSPLGVLRATLEDTKLCGYDIPKGSYVVPNIWAAHRDEKYFPDPMTFKPERFLDEDGKVLVPPQFLSFSIGKRACPGQELAVMMVFLVFVNLLHEFEIQPERGRRPSPLEEYTVGISARPLPYRVEIVPRFSKNSENM